MHLDLDRAVARASLTATTLDVEGEAARQIAADLGFIGLGEQFAHVIEYAGVGGGVRARRSPDRALICLLYTSPSPRDS